MWPLGLSLPTSGLNGCIQAINKPATGASVHSALDTPVELHGKKTRKIRNQKHKAKTQTMTIPLIPPFTYQVRPPRFLT